MWGDTHSCHCFLLMFQLSFEQIILAQRSGPGHTKIVFVSAVTKKPPPGAMATDWISLFPCPWKPFPIRTCSTPSHNWTCPRSPPVTIRPPSALTSIEVSFLTLRKPMRYLNSSCFFRPATCAWLSTEESHSKTLPSGPAESSHLPLPQDSALTASLWPVSTRSSATLSGSRVRIPGKESPTATCFPSALKPTA